RRRHTRFSRDWSSDVCSSDLGYVNASWTLKTELTCRYVTRLLKHMRETGNRQCTPVNDDPTVERRPLLGLNAGYILRAQDRFPKQGSRFPWQVYQSYLRDYRAMRLGAVDDGVMRFGNPAPAPEPGAPSAVATPA